jgi:hypothetical protein
MNGFTIQRTDDPSPYRDRILSFWNAYIPGTPPGRFDWLSSGNPAGPAVWFCALDSRTGEFAGTVSLMPRQLYAGGTPIRAAIMGDFMVGERYRAFGPYLMLLKEATGSRTDLGLDCIYTIPNPVSRKPCERVGMGKAKDLYCFVKPLMMRFYLEKVAPAVVAAALSPVVSASLKLASRELFVSPRGVREEALRFDARFDDFWSTLRDHGRGLIGDRSARYLAWRYAQNPLHRFRLLTYHDESASQIRGYLVFTLFESEKPEVYDICALNDGVMERLVAALVGIARAEGSRAIYFRSPLSSPALRIFKRFRFLKTNDDLELYYVGRTGIPMESWDFLSGDRNI